MGADRCGLKEESIEGAFTCTRCGNCCRSHGYVYLTTRDRVMLAIRFNLTVGVFTRQYCEKRHGEYHLKHPEKDCLFLDANGRCSIYEDRPKQCRTWPFWKSNIDTPEDWSQAAMRCPGINRGELCPHEEIVEKVNKTRE